MKVYRFIPIVLALIVPAWCQFTDAKKTNLVYKYKKLLVRKPTQSWAFDKLFRLYVEENKLQDLVEEYQKLVKESPSSSNKVVLARLYLELDKGEKALKLLQDVSNPTGAILLLTGKVQLKSSQFEKARKLIIKAIAKMHSYREKFKAYEILGMAYLQDGKMQQAVKLWQKLSQENFSNYRLRFKLAEMLLRNQLYKEAKKEYQSLIEIARGNVVKICAVKSKIAEVYEKQSQSSKAIKEYRDILKLLGPGHWMRKGVVKKLVRLYLRESRIDELVTYCEDSIKENPQDGGNYRILESLYMQTGKWKDAEEVLRRFILLYPKNIAASTKLRNVLEKQELEEEVIKEYHRILTAQPENLDLYMEFANYLAKVRTIEKAKVQWQKVFDKLKTADGCLRLASMYMNFKQFIDAERTFKKAIKLAPDDVGVLARLSEFYFKRGEEKKAIGELQHAITKFAKEPTKLMSIADICARFDKYQEALSCIEKAIKQTNNEFYLFNYANTLLIAGKKDKAIRSYLKLAKKTQNPFYLKRSLKMVINIHLQRGNLLEFSKKLEKKFSEKATRIEGELLARSYKRLTKRHLVLKIYQKLLEKYPNEQSVLESYADELAEREMPEKAAKIYLQLVEVNSNKKKYLHEAIKLYIKMSNYTEANSLIDRMLRLQVNNPFSYLQAGELFEKMENSKRALEMYTQAVRLDIKDVDLNLRLANKLAKYKRNKKAVKYYQAAFEHSKDLPKRISIIKKLSGLYMSLGLLKQKIESYRKRVGSNPYDFSAQLALAYLQLFNNEYGEATQNLQDILRYNPDNTDIRLALAEIYQHIEEYQLAIHQYQKAMKISGTNLDIAHLQLGKVYYSLGQRKQAIETWEKLTSLKQQAEVFNSYNLPQQTKKVYLKMLAHKPQQKNIRRLLGKMYLDHGEYQKAVATLESILILDPDDFWVISYLGKAYRHLGQKDKIIGLGRRILNLNTKKQQGRKVGTEKELALEYQRFLKTKNSVDLVCNFFHNNGIDSEDFLDKMIAENPKNYLLKLYALDFLEGKKLLSLAFSLIDQKIPEELLPPLYHDLGTNNVILKLLDSRMFANAREYKIQFAEKLANKKKFDLDVEYLVYGMTLMSLSPMIISFDSPLKRSLKPVLSIIEKGMKVFPQSKRLQIYYLYLCIKEKKTSGNS